MNVRAHLKRFDSDRFVAILSEESFVPEAGVIYKHAENGILVVGNGKDAVPFLPFIFPSVPATPDPNAPQPPL